LSFSPDDRTLASGSWDTTVRLWHVPSAQEIAALRAHHGRVEAVAFSPDGTVLATGGQRDADHGEVFLWRATSD
jgi:WD40 repeat protein